MATPSGTAEEEELSMTCVRLEMHPASHAVSVLQMVLRTGVTAYQRNPSDV